MFVSRPSYVSITIDKSLVVPHVLKLESLSYSLWTRSPLSPALDGSSQNHLTGAVGVGPQHPSHLYHNWLLRWKVLGNVLSYHP